MKQIKPFLLIPILFSLITAVNSSCQKEVVKDMVTSQSVLDGEEMGRRIAAYVFTHAFKEDE